IGHFRSSRCCLAIPSAEGPSGCFAILTGCRVCSIINKSSANMFNMYIRYLKLTSNYLLTYFEFGARASAFGRAFGGTSPKMTRGLTSMATVVSDIKSDDPRRNEISYLKSNWADVCLPAPRPFGPHRSVWMQLVL